MLHNLGHDRCRSQGEYGLSDSLIAERGKGLVVGTIPEEHDAAIVALLRGVVIKRTRNWSANHQSARQ
jgi:hypothetical protein